MRVVVKSGRRHNGRDAKGNPVTYEAGAQLDVTKSRYEAFKDKFELIGKDAEEAKSREEVKKKGSKDDPKGAGSKDGKGGKEDKE